MAKIAPKGKKVVGTKKKDKITWVSTKPWKKNLTAKAGSGNDVINFKKSKYKNTIYGDAGNDKIYGGKGTDKIYGGKGNDTINAGKGSNTLYFSKGDGTDTVLKGGGTDTLVFKTEKSLAGLKVAYSGNNAIITYNGGKVVLKDYKLGGHSAKYVQVGSTKKSIADLLKPPSPIVDGYYVINGTSGADNLVAKDGYDCKISGGAGNDTITGGAGNDQILGGAGDDVINAGAGNDSIYSGEGNNTINGGEGTDYIDVTNGTNLIIFDDVKPNWSHDNNLIETVSGFKNSDTIQVTVTQDGWHGMAPMFFDSKTKDLYLGVQGSGTYNIKITDYSNETRNGWISVDGNNAIRMSEFLTQNQMYLHTDEADNLSDIPSGTYYMLGGNDVVTGNVREVSYSEILIYAGDGNDSITGIGADYVTIYGEDGNDTISTDTYTIGDGTIYGGVGDDEITANDQRVKTILYGEDGNDKLTGGQYMDGGNGNDIITSSATGNTESSSRATYIIGGEGNDEMHVYNTHYNPVIYDFYLNQSDGNDVIYDDLVSMRQLRFMQRSQDKSFYDIVNEMKYIKNGNDLIIKYKDNNSDLYRNSITIKNFMTSENQTNLRYVDNYGDYYIVKTFIDANGYEEIIGIDEDEDFVGTGNDDKLNGMGGDDIITGGKGNDTLIGGDGANTYIYNDGDGLDTILTTSDEDILQFNDYNAADLDLLKSGKDLYITHSGNNIIKLKDFFNPQTLSRLQLKFADNSTRDIFEFIDDKGHSSEFNTYFVDYYAGIGINGTDADEIFVLGYGDVMAGKGNDSLYTYGAESDSTGEHVIYAGDGNDVIYQRGSNFNIQFLSATLNDLTAEGNWWMDGDDLVIKYDGVNTLTIKDYWSLDSGARQFRYLKENAVEENLWPDINPSNYSWNSFLYYFGKNPISGTSDADTLVGTDEDNHINAGAGNDSITGGKGNDILVGYTGTDTFVFNKGDGKDIVISAEIIKFNDVDISELDLYGGSNSRLYIQYGENDIIRCYTRPDKIVDKNDKEYSFKDNDTNIDSTGNYLIAGRKDSYDMINVSNAGANCIIFAQGGENDENKDNINISSGTATIMVKKQDVYTLINGTGSSNTTINFMDTTLNDVSLSNKQIHIIFNVSNTYNKDNNGLYAFGDVSFVDNDNLALWSSGQNYKGITVTNNSVQTIKTTDGYHLTNADIADLAQSVAGWLTLGGRNYGSVNDVLASNNETDITALIAQFDNANWQSSI